MKFYPLLLAAMVVACLITSAAVLELFGSSSSPVTLIAPGTSVPAEFFGLHIHRAFSTTPWPSVPFGSWRLWDAKVHWPQVETGKNTWQWDILDREVELAEKHHVDLLLPFGETPAWASAGPVQFLDKLRDAGSRREMVSDVADLDDWRNFVRTQATRYKGRILYYEIWNEPNLPKERNIGSPERMLALAREAYITLKQVDPNIRVVSPSPVNPEGLEWLEHYLALGGGKYADIIGYHFYVRTRPESMIELILQAKEIMKKHGVGDKPLWNTESGWIRSPLTVPIDLVRQAPGWAARAYILNWAAGVERFYWYAWDDDGHDSIPFTEEDQATATSSAQAYAQVQKWLIGSRVGSCARNAEGSWLCQLTRESGRPAWILWNENQTGKYDVPKSWAVQTITRLSGEQSAWSGNQIDIGELPLMLEGQKRPE